MSKGIIFNIQKFSIHDGPGIRTTVFLKGCPLKCKWCSNPESQLEKIQISCDKTKCTHCKSCINTCPAKSISMQNNNIVVDADTCIGCGNCIQKCPTSALSFEGEYKEVDEIVKVCMQDIDFYEESDGGITISGGEGMSQPQFLKALIKKLKEHNLHVAIETTGYIDPTVFQELASMLDLLLFDVKHYDSIKHFEGTNVHNELILENLKWSVEHNINLLVRIPVIPDFNDSLDDAIGLATILQNFGIKKAQLLPFHQFGEKKYELLNMIYTLKDKKALYPEDLHEYQQIFIDKGIECIF